MDIGHKIKKIRELRNYTQEYMAEQLNMSQAGYSKIERNEVDITFSKITQIAEILNVGMMDLLGFNEKLVINNFSSNQGSNQGIIHTQINNNEQKLYEDKIKLLEDKINYLQEIIERLKGG